MYFFLLIVTSLILLWIFKNRKYSSSNSVSSAYDSWTNDKLLEKLWGEHIHLGYYSRPVKNTDFKQAKIEFVHQLVKWSGLNTLPKGSRILDVGCGIGGSSRILARDYGFDVIGITISSEQVKRSNQLTPKDVTCKFQAMNALELQFDNETFDAIWSVEAGAHILDKKLFADEMLRVLKPGGKIAIADWNRRDYQNKKLGLFEKLVMKQLLEQWAHPDFASIKGFKTNLLNSKYNRGDIDCEDWTIYTLPSWNDSILEGIRRLNIFVELGPKSFILGLREVPTILLMRFAFKSGLMQFGVFKVKN